MKSFMKGAFTVEAELSFHKNVWERLGVENPYYSVLSLKFFEGEDLDENKMDIFPNIGRFEKRVG